MPIPLSRLLLLNIMEKRPAKKKGWSLIACRYLKRRKARRLYLKKRKSRTSIKIEAACYYVVKHDKQYYSLASVGLLSLWVSFGSSSRPSTVFSGMFTTYNACDVQYSIPGSIYLVGIGTLPPAGCRSLHSLITDFPPVSCCRTRLSLSARTLLLLLLQLQL